MNKINRHASIGTTVYRDVFLLAVIILEVLIRQTKGRLPLGELFG